MRQETRSPREETPEGEPGWASRIDRLIKRSHPKASPSTTPRYMDQTCSALVKRRSFERNLEFDDVLARTKQTPLQQVGKGFRALRKRISLKRNPSRTESDLPPPIPRGTVGAPGANIAEGARVVNGEAWSGPPSDGDGPGGSEGEEGDADAGGAQSEFERESQHENEGHADPSDLFRTAHSQFGGADIFQTVDTHFRNSGAPHREHSQPESWSFGEPSPTPGEMSRAGRCEIEEDDAMDSARENGGELSGTDEPTLSTEHLQGAGRDSLDASRGEGVAAVDHREIHKNAESGNLQREGSAGDPNVDSCNKDSEKFSGGGAAQEEMEVKSGHVIPRRLSEGDEFGLGVAVGKIHAEMHSDKVSTPKGRSVAERNLSATGYVDLGQFNERVRSYRRAVDRWLAECDLEPEPALETHSAPLDTDIIYNHRHYVDVPLQQFVNLPHGHFRSYSGGTWEFPDSEMYADSEIQPDVDASLQRVSAPCPGDAREIPSYRERSLQGFVDLDNFDPKFSDYRPDWGGEGSGEPMQGKEPIVEPDGNASFDCSAQQLSQYETEIIAEGGGRRRASKSKSRSGRVRTAGVKVKKGLSAGADDLGSSRRSPRHSKIRSAYIQSETPLRSSASQNSESESPGLVSTMDSDYRKGVRRLMNDDMEAFKKKIGRGHVMVVKGKGTRRDTRNQSQDVRTGSVRGSQDALPAVSVRSIRGERRRGGFWKWLTACAKH